MALVYKAECTLLQRIVAVKVLRAQYSSDKEFVDRFRREAQSAASLSHPNMVNIYDVGEEDGIHYIVMEYIEGKTLKDLINKEAPLPVNQAVRIALQIAEALKHAHERNIVHRDIKPHNILLTADGRAKVTDFGIARAVSAGGYTQTGVVMGSVQYFSPEQAKGVTVGPQSDLYSLGCVLYEMLSGEVPFEGESPISIALKHLQEEPLPINKFSSNLPSAVVSLVNRAMAKDLGKRYASAKAMIKDLQAVLGLDADSTKAEDYPTQVMTPVANEATTEEEDSPVRSGKTWLVFLIALFGACALFVFGFIYLLPSKPPVEVPDLVGVNLEEAEALVAERGLKVRVVSETHHQMQTGLIVSQDPAANRTVRRGREIKVVVSKGAETVHVPNVIGKSRREAEIILEEARLQLGGIYTELSSDVPKDRVVRQKPAPSMVIQKGASVDLYLSLGPDYDKVEVPNFIGRRLVDVQARLASLGLVFESYELEHSSYPEGQILDQQPPPGSIVPLGTPLKFVISGVPGGGHSGEGENSFGPRKEKRINITINQGPEEQNVEVILEDDRGREIIYENLHHPGESFGIDVESYGEARVYVYINGVLSYDEKL